MSESRLRIIVACGAAGGISATFNAPITGVFFGFEIVLREFSLDALFATILAAVTADLVSRAFFGSAPFFAQIPHDLVGQHTTSPTCWSPCLASVAGLIGVGFKTVLYRLEDAVDRLWEGRPSGRGRRSAASRSALVLLALPQMYGVGYPVMDKVIAGHVVLWLVLIFMVGKIVAASLTLGDRRLRRGLRSLAVHRGDGRDGLRRRSPTSLRPGRRAARAYAVVAMGGVFAAAAQAPLTAIASVVEMTGNFGLTVAVMLACGHRRRGLQAAHLRHHLHDQAPAPRHRHRAATTRPVPWRASRSPT